MSRAIERGAAARRDLLDVFVYIGRKSAPSARRFLIQAESTFRRLAASPSIGTRYDPDSPALADLRYFPIARFPKYLVFYRPTADGIDVVRVVHGARDLEALFPAGADEPGPVDGGDAK
jgi:toxin ParE1/3/4